MFTNAAPASDRFCDPSLTQQNPYFYPAPTTMFGDECFTMTPTEAP
jgi:hypothetical protein